MRRWLGGTLYYCGLRLLGYDPSAVIAIDRPGRCPIEAGRWIARVLHREAAPDNFTVLLYSRANDAMLREWYRLHADNTQDFAPIQANRVPVEMQTR